MTQHSKSMKWTASQSEMHKRYRHNLQSALAVAVLSGYIVARAAHVAP
jgi:hypothetical protein